MNIINMRGTKEAPRAVRSKMDTLLVNRSTIESWVLPSFQRELRENEKVRDVAELIKQNGGIVPGIMTLGQIGDEKTINLVDGQHRRHAALLTALEEFIVDVRICHFDTRGDMAREFFNLNSALAKMRPDDFLRAMEPDDKVLRALRRECPFITYGQVRRGREGSALLGMSTALRAWCASMRETPSCTDPAPELTGLIQGDQIEHMTRYYALLKSAWGDGVETYRLWGGLNLALCAWLYQQLVVDRQRGIKRHVVLSVEQFKKCMMSVSADGEYSDWLLGRSLGERDRSPCYGRLKSIFVSRLKNDTGMAKPMLPQPAWSTSSNSGKNVGSRSLSRSRK